MKSKTLIFFLILFFALSIWSCIREKKLSDYDITKYKWEVVKIKKANNTLYKNTDEIYILEFQDDNEFSINLDVNSCYAVYKIGDESFTVSSLGCTEMCCDSDYAVDLSAILTDAEKYYTTENELHISGKGNVVFRKIKE